MAKDDDAAAQNGGWSWASFVSTVAVSVVTGGLVQAIVLVRWSGITDERLARLAAEVSSNETRLGQIDVIGTRTIPVMTERLSAAERAHIVVTDRLNLISARLDAFVNQVHRLETPLSQKVFGLEGVANAMRDSLEAIRIRIVGNEATIRRLQEISDSRSAIITRAEVGFQDIILLKQGLAEIQRDIARMEERIGRIVAALDSTYGQLQQHLREPRAGSPDRDRNNPSSAPP